MHGERLLGRESRSSAWKTRAVDKSFDRELAIRLRAVATVRIVKMAASASGVARSVQRWECEAGSIGNLRLVHDDLSAPQPGFVQVQVAAAGLNFADVFAVQGSGGQLVARAEAATRR
jgi:hypothetical protein